MSDTKRRAPGGTREADAECCCGLRFRFGERDAAARGSSPRCPREQIALQGPALAWSSLAQFPFCSEPVLVRTTLGVSLINPDLMGALRDHLFGNWSERAFSFLRRFSDRVGLLSALPHRLHLRASLLRGLFRSGGFPFSSRQGSLLRSRLGSRFLPRRPFTCFALHTIGPLLQLKEYLRIRRQSK